MCAAQQQLGDTVYTSEYVDCLDWLGHRVLSSEQVQVQDRAIIPHDQGLRGQEGNALEL